MIRCVMRLFLAGSYLVFILVISVTTIGIEVVNAQSAVGTSPFSAPLKQLQMGTLPTNVKCNQSFHLVIKTEDGTPACVSNSAMGRMTRQGWWAWNEKVGNTIVNGAGKRPFDVKNCGLISPSSSVVGTSGFVKDSLPPDGILYQEQNLKGLEGPFNLYAIKPNSTTQIIFTYDFNPYPGSKCNVTTKDAIRASELSTQPYVPLSELIVAPDIMKVNKTDVRVDVPLVNDHGDIAVHLSNVQDINDHVAKVIYNITTKPDAKVGNSYYIGFWWNGAVVVTVGNTLYNGTALSGTRYG